MLKKYSTLLLLLALLFSCRRKHIPEKNAVATVVTVPAKNDSIVVRKKNFTPRKKDIIPPSIVVNDKAAKKAIDGRLYYDLLGHRYWKNYKDGKYYLFNQKMYDNPAFKPPK